MFIKKKNCHMIPRKKYSMKNVHELLLYEKQGVLTLTIVFSSHCNQRNIFVLVIQAIAHTIFAHLALLLSLNVSSEHKKSACQRIYMLREGSSRRMNRNVKKQISLLYGCSLAELCRVQQTRVSDQCNIFFIEQFKLIENISATDCVQSQKQAKRCRKKERCRKKWSQFSRYEEEDINVDWL